MEDNEHPSPNRKIELLEKVKKCIREDLHTQVDLIVNLSNTKDLLKLEDMLSSKKYTSSVITQVCIELDFLSSKLKYFGKITNEDLSFGIDFELIPELISKWRDEKIDKIL